MTRRSTAFSVILTAFLLGLTLLTSLPAWGEDATGEPNMKLNLLVFTRTTGYRHASIEDGVKMLEKLCDEHGYTMTHTEDPGVFTDESLAGYTVVIFLSTSGDVLDESQQQAFERYIQSGGAFVGIHGASATEQDWVWYGKLVGAFFTDHPAIQEAVVRITEPDHVCMHGLPNPWTRNDEWYNFRDVRPGLTVLAEADESSYEGGAMGEHHPIVWCHQFEGARSFYTALGHTPESYTDPAFVGHVHRGILWAAGVEQE